MSIVRFIRARQGPRHSVIYTTNDGEDFKYSGGDWAWRNNNPGNLRPGNVSKRNGAIGKAGGFAVFPDSETGHEALLDALKTTFWNKSLEQLIHAYAPPNENKTKKYLKFLRDQTGVRDGRQVKDFSAEEFKKLWRAIERMEGGHPGEIESFTKKRISKVRKNKKGTITGYFVEGMGWLTKSQGIQLARQRKIDAVVARSRSGNLFLRTRPGTPVEIQLEHLG